MYIRVLRVAMPDVCFLACVPGRSNQVSVVHVCPISPESITTPSNDRVGSRDDTSARNANIRLEAFVDLRISLWGTSCRLHLPTCVHRIVRIFHRHGSHYS
jgi:hypothetical protein